MATDGEHRVGDVKCEDVRPTGDEVQYVPLFHDAADGTARRTGDRCWRMRRGEECVCRAVRWSCDSGLHDGIARWPLQDSKVGEDAAKVRAGKSS